MITGVIEKSIFVVQGHTVMLDSDLAKLYGVPTHRLNEQVKRNISRFPQDFMVRLSEEDAVFLRSQNAISKMEKVADAICHMFLLNKVSQCFQAY